MNLKELFHQEMLDIYYKTGKASHGGYWPHRFLAAVRKHGGLQWAKKSLAKKMPEDGFNKLIKYDIVHLSVESLVLDVRFRELFTQAELAEARKRLSSISDIAK